MKKKTGIIIASCVAAAAIIGCGVWYFTIGNKKPEEPKNAQSVSTITDGTSTPAPEAEAENDENNGTQTPAAGQKPAKGADSSNPPKATQKAEKVKPTFMYFVTNADMQAEATQKVIADLKKEYEDRVVFDIKNVDEDPSLLENFSLVNNQTPALIMLNTNNDISKFLFKTTDLNQLKEAIENALKA